MSQSYISPVILARIPEYIQQDYPEYTQFLTDYIQSLEQDKGFLQILNDWRKNADPTTADEVYVDTMLKDMGLPIGINITVPKSVLMHMLRDLFLSRGSENSYRILFQALFGVKVSIRYPRDKLLVPSAASYQKSSFIFCLTDTWYNTPEYAQILEQVVESGGTVSGSDSGAVAQIQSITPYGYADGVYWKIEISEPIKEFRPSDLLQIKVASITISEPILSIVMPSIVGGGSSYSVGDRVRVHGGMIPGVMTVEATKKGGIDNIVIVSGGCQYQVGDIILASGTNLGGGFSAYVTQVDSHGTITATEISSQGTNYRVIPNLMTPRSVDSACLAVLKATSNSIMGIKSVTIESPCLVKKEDIYAVTIDVKSQSGQGATLQPVIHTRFQNSAWIDKKGVLGYNSIPVDSYKYQQFSYMVSSSIDSSKYDALVQRYLHPAGYVRISETAVLNPSVTLSLSSDFQMMIPTSLTLQDVVVTYTLNPFSLSQQDAPDDIVVKIGTESFSLATHNGDEIVWH